MAWQATHKETSKNRILESAALLFTQHGFEQISIDQVMKKAALTRGAFYSHFSSKSDLYSQAIGTAAKVAIKRRPVSCPKQMKDFAQYYLSPEHRDNQLEQGCPLAYLVSDIGQQNEQVKEAYTKTLKGFIAEAEKVNSDREQALQSVVLMVGGLAISRALADQEFSNELLSACQAGVNILASKPT